VNFPRFSIAEMMAIVALAALDCWAIRLKGTVSTVRLLVVGALPMLNFLVVGLLFCLGRRTRSRISSTFLVAFEVTGWVALLMFVAVCVQASESLTVHLSYALSPFLNAMGFRPYSPADFVWRYAVAMCYLTAPQLAAAWVAGGITQRWLKQIACLP